MSELADKLKALVDTADKAWAELTGTIENLKDCLEEIGLTKPKSDEDGGEKDP